LLENTVNELRDLKHLGVARVMNDFGSGYSSLNYISKFPCTKIRQSPPTLLARSSPTNVEGICPHCGKSHVEGFRQLFMPGCHE
jgi:hypothetical protein